ncbi:hypothetical protein BDW72DRAFT_199102 [Aspergillus terricola var. indicus]
MASKCSLIPSRLPLERGVRTGATIYTLHATREVIVSAGAFQSPQLLMAPEISPAETLESHGIPQIVDLRGAGQNMWDHLLFSLSYRVSIPTNTKIPTNLAFAAEEAVRYFTKDRGLFTNPGPDYLAWEKIPEHLISQFSPETLANLSWFLASWLEAEYISFAVYLDSIADPFFMQPKDGYMYASIISSLVAPTSRGHVTICSNNTDKLPLINPTGSTLSPTLKLLSPYTAACVRHGLVWTG